jgi:hypothetical protein
MSDARRAEDLSRIGDLRRRHIPVGVIYQRNKYIYASIAPQRAGGEYHRSFRGRAVRRTYP